MTSSVVHDYALPTGVILLPSVNGYGCPTLTLTDLQGTVGTADTAPAEIAVGHALVRPKRSGGSFTLDLIVPPYARGKGYEAYLLKEVLKRLFEMRGSPIELFVGREDTETHRLYEQHGGQLCLVSKDHDLFRYVFHSPAHVHAAESEAVAA